MVAKLKNHWISRKKSLMKFYSFSAFIFVVWLCFDMTEVRFDFYVQHRYRTIFTVLQSIYELNIIFFATTQTANMKKQCLTLCSWKLKKKATINFPFFCCCLARLIKAYSLHLNSNFAFLFSRNTLFQKKKNIFICFFFCRNFHFSWLCDYRMKVHVWEQTMIGKRWLLMK